MRINIKDNIKEVTKGMSSIQKKQIPFATMLALNDTAFKLQKTYKAQTKQKFTNATKFTQTGFMVEKAKKNNLTATVFVSKKREDYMKLEVDGGIRKPKNRAIVIANKSNSGAIAKFPSGNINKGAMNKLRRNKQKYFFGKPKGNQGSEGIWERYGRESSGKSAGHKIRQVARLSKFGNYKAKYPFETIGQGVAFSRKSGFDSAFAKRLRHALKTAK